ncbi:aspartate aminotransferase [Actinomycetota bacterium]|nr:aspartate aminotransferase [Actinomycetota bacterium]
MRTAKTKVVLFCSPSNPTGSVYSPEQVKAIGNWALANGLWVVTDEIYEHLLYDGATAPSICVAVPALADRTIIINGVAKTYAMTGWRVGWMIGPKDVIKAATNLQSHLSSMFQIFHNAQQSLPSPATYLLCIKWVRHLIVVVN